MNRTEVVASSSIEKLFGQLSGVQEVGFANSLGPSRRKVVIACTSEIVGVAGRTRLALVCWRQVVRGQFCWVGDQTISR